MLDRKELIFRIGVLAAIALTATVLALAVENYFGGSALFAALGQGLAMLGAVTFALWLLRRSNGSQ
jgi:hypothetical protein